MSYLPQRDLCDGITDEHVNKGGRVTLAVAARALSITRSAPVAVVVADDDGDRRSLRWVTKFTPESPISPQSR